MDFNGAVLLAVVLLAQLVGTYSQSEGDVRLIGAIPANKYRGRLEIYWKGKWSTFCGINSRGADAACKQLGFANSFIFSSYKKRSSLNLNVSRATNDTPIAIASTFCSNSVEHVLRCDYSSDVPSTCTHDDDMILFCAPSSRWLHPYETEVRLNSTTYYSTGVVEMYANDQWGNICANKFNQGAADSVCRQMGFTGAKTFSVESQMSAPTTWLSEVKCSQSCSCLNGCFGKTPSEPAQCNSGSYATVTCTFDVTKINSATAGSDNDCENRQGTCGGGSGSGPSHAGVIVGVVIVLLVVVGIAICVVSIVIFFFIYSRNRKGYYNING